MERPVNEWDLVVKVKYGDTLRRFAAYVCRGTVDYDMDKLRAKIFSLFKFCPDTELVLTYTDEDGDVVTLVDDSELLDAVVRQHLNPLRINVQLETNSAAKSETVPHFDSSTSGSARRGSLTMQGTTSIDKILQPLLCRALSKFSCDLMSKAALSTLPLAELVAYFSKLGQSYVGQLSRVSTDAAPGRASSNTTGPIDLDVNGQTEPFSEHVSESTFTPRPSCDQMPENNQKQPEWGNISCGKGTSDSGSPVDLNLDFSDFPTVKESVTTSWISKGNIELEKENDHCSGKPVAAMSPPLISIFDQTAHQKSHYIESVETSVNSIAVTPSLFSPIDDQMVLKKSQNLDSTKPSITCIPNLLHTGFSHGDRSRTTPTGTTSTSQFGSNLQNGIPINGHVDEHDIGTPASEPFGPDGLSQIFSPHRRAYGHCDSMLPTFHRGVQCDGCGMHPIMGPRFKSNVKEDYDLCSICFSGVGQEVDYTRIDQEAYWCPRFLRDFYDPHARFQNPHGCRGYGIQTLKGKLESRFIQDVTIPDKILMAPSAPFTKIWRMHNSGTVVWPSGTQLVWIEGDQLREKVSVDIEIPDDGFPVGGEIDITVDFRAPSVPGHYVSYWSLVSPFGQKFGQCIWFVIQVENFCPGSGGTSFHEELNLNLPPQSSRQSGHWSIDVNADPLDDAHSSSEFLEPDIELVKPLVDEIPNGNVKHDQVDGLQNISLADGECTLPVPKVSLSASFSRVDLSELVSPDVDLTAVEAPSDIAPSDIMGDDNPLEQTLLWELEEMGFNQIDLNKEILRLNEYDLERSLNDLCEIADLHPLLEDLQDMGFCDEEKKRLLVKNGGCIKRVVLDLIAGKEKAK